MCPRKIGELWTRSAKNMLGYWNNPDATVATVTDEGWLKTGDAGYVDERWLHVPLDRVKDMIVSGGENVYPAEVENVLMTHPAISEVAVIGVPTRNGAKRSRPIVVRGWNRTDRAADHRLWARAPRGLQVPTSVDFVDALPRNPSGKVLKRQLREPYWEGKERRIG